MNVQAMLHDPMLIGLVVAFVVVAGFWLVQKSRK